MNSSLLWKPAVTLLVVILALYSALPLDKKINLGLDLQGGIHLIMEVDVAKATENVVRVYGRELKTTFREKDIDYNRVRSRGNKLNVSYYDVESMQKGDAIIKEQYPNLTETARDDEQLSVKYLINPQYQKEVENNAVEQAVETIRNRIDLFGVAEPTIQKIGLQRILVQLPGIQDTDRAIKLIGKTALLEFKLVDEDNSVQEALKGNIPEGDIILYEIEKLADGKEKRTPYLLKDTTILTGRDLTNADVRVDSQLNEPYVSLNFNKQGARIFKQVTGENVKKRMAIILDGVIHSAPVIQEQIGGGRAQISGGFDFDEAHDLAIILRAGSLPAPITILENRTVGPSLGKLSIKQGMNSFIWATLIVFAFMIVYYRMSGLIADTALILNVIILMGVLAYFHATLTLPGIAGIILTVGIAVDANVLIFERIREELRNGKPIRASVNSGFDKAFATIVDSNITTLLAAIILIQFGTGPIRGFAVTLGIGICASMFTAVFVTKFLFDFYLMSKRRKSISI